MITPTNHNRTKPRDEPIRILGYYLLLGQRAGKIARTTKVQLVLVLLLTGRKTDFYPITKLNNGNRVDTLTVI